MTCNERELTFWEWFIKSFHLTNIKHLLGAWHHTDHYHYDQGMIKILTPILPQQPSSTVLTGWTLKDINWIIYKTPSKYLTLNRKALFGLRTFSFWFWTRKIDLFANVIFPNLLSFTSQRAHLDIQCHAHHQIFHNFIPFL